MNPQMVMLQMVITENNSKSLTYKASLLNDMVAIAGAADGTPNRKIDNAKIAVTLKYVSNFFRALEMPLINCKIHLEHFQLTDTKLYVPVVTLSAKDNINFIKQQNEGFKRSAYWNEYKSDVSTQTADLINAKRFQLDPYFQGVNRLFVLAFSDNEADKNRATRDGHRRYFVPRIDINNCNFVIDGRNFYDNPISSQIEKYDELRKIAMGKGDGYIPGCLLDYQYFKKALSINCS